MESFEVNKILDLYNSKDYSDSDAYERSIPPCIPLRSNIWVFLDELEEFNFVRDIINRDLQNIDVRYKCGFYTLLIYQKGDFFAEHTDESTIYSDSEISTSPQDEEKILFTGGYELNREYKGGNFFVDGKELGVDIGELFYFRRDVLHEVKEVKEGTRYSLHFMIENI
jgi:hypothetical protein